MNDEKHAYALCDLPTPLQSAALELFEGNENAAAAWVNQPCRALNSAVPAQVACASAAGLQLTLDVIIRIEHGVHQ